LTSLVDSDPLQNGQHAPSFIADGQLSLPLLGAATTLIITALDFDSNSAKTIHHTPTKVHPSRSKASDLQDTVAVRVTFFTQNQKLTMPIGSRMRLM
jgi:hypothetical protein